MVDGLNADKVLIKCSAHCSKIVSLLIITVVSSALKRSCARIDWAVHFVEVL